LNAISDVSGVGVGHVTVIRDEPEPPHGRGAARTGVSVVLPAPHASVYDASFPAALAVLNGAGELTGSLQVAEWGVLETPVYLTATMSVGRVYDGAVAIACAADASIGRDRVVIPVVGECDDSHLNDARTVQVDTADARHAVESADPLFEQGCVGAGTGMVALGWKGGIGSASRRVDRGTVGVLVLANFGTAEQLRIDGVPMFEAVGSGVEPEPRPAGSCIAIVATDLPLTTHQLRRVARRCGLGLARTGSVAHHGSGEIFLAFSTERSGTARCPDDDLNGIFTATVEATEEAVLNALWTARDTVGCSGRVVRALPHEGVLEVLDRNGRLGAARK
jgi:D-aminopeptidase